MLGWCDSLRVPRISRSTGDATAQESQAKESRGIFGDAGATLMEFALSTSVLLIMLMGIITMCLAFYTYNFVADAAREATRYAIVRGSTCTNLPDCNATASQVSTYVKQLGFPGMTASNLTVSTSWLTASSTRPTTWSACTSGTCNVPGNGVRVVVTYAFPLTLPFVSPDVLNLSSTSQMVLSQ